MPDYGNGLTNIDMSNGIRYGVISCNTPAYLYEDMEMLYPPMECECGWVDKDNIYPDECPECGAELEPDDMAESIGWKIDDGTILAEDCLYNDAMILKSDWVAYVAWCSPCVPGAGDLDFPRELGQDGCWAYCLPKDYFDEQYAPCPYEPMRLSDWLEMQRFNILNVKLENNND